MAGLDFSGPGTITSAVAFAYYCGALVKIRSVVAFFKI